ncbi:alpha/beta fold hydrolase [Phenylobacterium sp.]|jgi:pimeloyl-ACP methyl ester carboxylesterase|uniref:alpha/beta fold hydrolase n=1 Tax=Phenylobacterium sp. TaxID=1871053 RepID=UPI0037C7C8F7
MAATIHPLRPPHDPDAQILGMLGDAIDPADDGQGGAPITLPAQALAAAGFDASGELRAGDRLFLDWFASETASEVVADWLTRGEPMSLAPIRTRDGVATVLLLARREAAAGWRLPAGAALQPGAAVVALAYRPFAVRELAERALTSWRLTPVEARVVQGLISAGDLIEGARRAATGYETARKALKSALRRAGATRQADLVRLLHAAVGGGDLHLAQAPLLRAALGLSDRAAGASVLLALGLTRAEAAATLRISEHAIKDELAVVFGRFGLGSVTDLARLTTEAMVLLGVAGNRNLTLGASWSALRPLRFVGRADGSGRIALSDFGPASGAPVLLFHSAVTGALLDRGLVRALHRQGFRPIAVERPGFGLTDPAVGNPDEVAVADIVDILDALKLRAVRILARGGEDTALRFAAAYPDRMAHAVLINPFTPYALDTRRDGYMNAMKWLMARQPAMIEAVARFLAPRLDPRTTEQLVRRSLASSAADTAVLGHPTVLEDYVESARLVALRETAGFVHEQRRYLTWTPSPLPSGARWTRMIGEQDVLYRPGDAEAVWQTALPGHRVIRRSDAGRMLHASHPDLVAEALVDGPVR